MALWNKVLSGFDREDETVNFGARTVAENNGSIYETSTIATIQSDGKVIKQPKVFASLEYLRVCIAIDKSITIFENETCEDILLSIGFDLLIQCYCISKDGLFLFVVLKNGTLYCLYLLGGGKIIFKKNITSDRDNIIKIYLEDACNEYFNINLVANSGAIYRLSQFKTNLIESTIINNDAVALQQLVKDIQCSQLFAGFGSDEVIGAAVGAVNTETVIAMVCSNMLFMWPGEQYHDFNTLSYKYTKVQFLKNRIAMLCLRTDQMLNIVCPQTLLGLKVYRDPVLDFTVFDNDDNSLCKILLLVESKDTHNTCILRVISYPDLEQKFEIYVPVTTYLVNIMDSCDGTILFLEGINDTESGSGIINTMRIKNILESSPEYQLQRLLRREQFDAAEAFAEKLNISRESIYCAKVTLLLRRWDPWAKTSSDPTELGTIIDVLDKIRNVQYVVECCSNVLIPDYKQMREIHLYARRRIAENTEGVQTDNHLKLLCFINDTLRKLETFHMIWRSQISNESYDNDTMKEWIRFSRANLMDEYKLLLNLGEMEAATLIWMRHLSDVAENLSIKSVRDIFVSVPEKISLSLLWSWLQNFVPTLLSLIPDAMYEIILWGCKKVESLEQFHHSEWPEISIEFGNKFIRLLKFEEHHQTSLFHQEYMHQNSALKQFIILMQNLSDIKQLKATYRLTISLDSYVREPIEVSHMLLNKIHIDAIPEFVNTFLKSYMLNNSLQDNQVFSAYIQKTVGKSKSWWSGEENPWEKRVITIIDLIDNIENRLKQTLDVLKKAPIPWSANIVNLAEKNSNVDHPLALKIRTEYKCVPIKLILKLYGYESIGVNERLIRRIIKVNRNDMITHLLELTKNDLSSRRDALSTCVNYYLSRGNLINVMKVLNMPDDDVLLYCCANIINHVRGSLTFKIMPGSVVHYVEMFGWIKVRLEAVLEHSKTHAFWCSDILATLAEVRSLYLLRKEFQINITVGEYHTKKDQVLKNYIEELYNENMSEHGELSIVYKKVTKVADLLGLQKLNGVSSLLERTKNITVLKCYTGNGKRDLNLTREECQSVNKMCLSVLQHINMDADASTIIQNLSASALCVCPIDDLQPLLISNTWANLYRKFCTKHCSNSAHTNQEEIERGDWKVYTIYKDLAIESDHFLIPLFREAIVIHVNNSKSGEENNGDGKPVALNNQLSTKELLNGLLDKVRKLAAGHNDYCLLQIIKTVYHSFHALPNVDPTMLNATTSVFLYFLMALLNKIISARKFDVQLGLSCLLMLSEQQANKWIFTASKSFQADYRKHLSVALLGYEYFRLTKNKLVAQTFKDKMTLHRWAQRLSKYSISYKEMLESDATGKTEILQRIMNCSNDDMISLLQDFCCDFGFVVSDCLLLYLQILLKSWNPTLNIFTSNEKKELHIHEDEANELRNKCNVIAAKISDKTALKNCIIGLQPQINFYHYEVFIILMDLLEEKNIGHKSYIRFLQNYTRTGQPTQLERDEWVHRNPESNSLPPIAEWRLPFLPTIELWKLITPELNLKTYEKWLQIAPILKLQPHIVCSLAIKGEVAQAWENINSQHHIKKWVLSLRNGNLLTDIKKCIEQMTGPDKLYYGTAALYYVVNHTPPGADQVAAIEECYTYAQLAVQNSTVFEEGMLEKIKFKYLRFTSEHILRVHGLGNKNYLSLIVNPEKLIRELYKDESIPQRYRCVTDNRPDINSAVSALSKLCSINLMKLRLELLHEWLQPDSEYMKFNESVTETISLFNTPEQNSNCDDNLFRACYLLDHEDVERSANFLINIAFGDDDDDNNNYAPEVRYRALCVLQTIIDASTLEELTKRDLHSIGQYMKSLKYIGKLESLGLGYTINTFETCSKNELVQILWTTQNYSPQALVVIAQLCVDYEIHEHSLWDKIFIQMTKLLMINELKTILLQVRNNIIIVNSNGYVSAWQVIVSQPFKKMDVNPRSEQINNCVDTLCLLQYCPIVHMLNYTDVIRNCFQCKQPHLAAALLPFINDNDKKLTLETIENTFEYTKVLDDLCNLSERGVLAISYCVRIMQDTLGKKQIL